MAVVVKRFRFTSGLDLNNQQSRLIERVTVSGLVVTPGHEQDALFEIAGATGMPALGSGLEDHEQFVLRRILVSGFSDSIGEALLHWELDGFGGTPSVSIITESTVTIRHRTNTIPGTRVPMMTGSFRESDGMGGGTGPLVPSDGVTFDILQPHRTINVSSIMAGELPEDRGNEVGKVNDQTWRGLPKGYWLLDEHTTSISKYTGYYQQRLNAMSRVIEDWSEIAILVNTQTGRAVDPNSSQVTTAVADMAALDYAFGIIYNEEFSGLLRFGPYPMTNFSDFFGF